MAEPLPPSTPEETSSTPPTPRRLLTTIDLDAPSPSVLVKHHSLLQIQVPGFFRGSTKLFPFKGTLLAFKLLDKRPLTTFTQRRDKLGLPTYRATPDEIRALKTSLVVTDKATRVLLMDEDNMTQFITNMMEEEGMPRPGVVDIDQLDDDDEPTPTPTKKGGRKKTMDPDLLPQAIHDEIERFRDSVTRTLTRGESIAAETWRKTHINTLSKCAYMYTVHVLHVHVQCIIKINLLIHYLPPSLSLSLSLFFSVL